MVERKQPEPSAGLACTFRLGDRWFGVDARSVQEVSALSRISPIPHAPALVRGYVNLRGHLQLVVDLRGLLGIAAPTTERDARLIVFQPAVVESLAVLVDEVGDIVTIPAEQIDVPRFDSASPEDSAAVRTPAEAMLLGYAKLEPLLITLLDPRCFLPERAAHISAARSGPLSAGTP